MSKCVAVTRERVVQLAKCPMTWGFLLVGFFLFLPEFGFCANETINLDAQLTDLQTSADKLRAFVFSKPIRVAVFSFAFVIGFVMSVIGQSLKPLFIPMMIGAIYYFVPSIIDTYDKLWG